jgi:hypothetical protein
VTDLEGTLVFAGVPLAVVALVFALVFLTTKKSSREPITKPLLGDDSSSEWHNPGSRQDG